jgi:hypothetical protein
MLRALSFAHLLGNPGTNARAEEDDERDDAPKSRKAKSRRAEEDDDQDDDAPKSRKAKGRRADDNDDEDDAPKSRKAKGRRAEEDDDEDDAPKSRKAKGRRAEEDDDEDDAPKSRKAKGRRAEEDDDEEDGPKGRRTAAEDDDEDEEERQDDADDRDPKARAARKRERARCAAIFGSKHAAGRVAAAANLAFNTKMTASQAIVVLKTLPQEEAFASTGGGLGERMGAYGGHRPSAFAPPPPSGRQAKANSWDAAAQRAGIGRK